MKLKCIPYRHLLFFIQQNEVTEQSKILTTLRTEYESEQGKVDELNVVVQEIKVKIIEIKKQMQHFENEIQAKQKSIDDFGENLTRREAMIKFHQKQKKHLTEAMIKYEVSIEENLLKIEFVTE